MASESAKGGLLHGTRVHPPWGAAAFVSLGDAAVGGAPLELASLCRWCALASFAVLVTIGLASAVVSGADAPEASGVPEASESPADMNTMADLRKAIEALPEDRREVDGAAILEEWLPRFSSDAVRQRVVLSLGDLARRRGRVDDAVAYWRRAEDLDADPLLTTRARESIAEAMSESGNLDDALRQLAHTPEPTREIADAANLPPGVTDGVYNTEVKRIELLTKHRRLEEAFERIVRLAELYPDHRDTPLVLAEGLTTVFFLTKDHESCVKWRRRIVDAIPYAADSETFLGNAIAEAMSAGTREEAASLMLDYVARFPNGHATPSWYFTLAGFERDKGDLPAAIASYRKAIATGGADSQVGRIAERNLAQLEGRTIGPQPMPAEATARWKPRTILLVINALLVAAIAAWWLARRRGRV